MTFNAVLVPVLRLAKDDDSYGNLPGTISRYDEAIFEGTDPSYRNEKEKQESRDKKGETAPYLAASMTETRLLAQATASCTVPSTGRLPFCAE